MKELHLIVDWNNFFCEGEMIGYIKQFDMDLCEILYISKLKNKVETLSKFYKYPVGGKY